MHIYVIFSHWVIFHQSCHSLIAGHSFSWGSSWCHLNSNRMMSNSGSTPTVHCPSFSTRPSSMVYLPRYEPSQLSTLQVNTCHLLHNSSLNTYTHTNNVLQLILIATICLALYKNDAESGMREVRVQFPIGTWSFFLSVVMACCNSSI
mgnify:CR=1 FL=1